MPCYVGYHNASAEGAGGVWFSLIPNMPPMVWQISFPPNIATEIVLPQCPHGRITNSDLEPAAEVLAVGILLVKAPIVKHEPIITLWDNTPIVSWIEKMASKSASPIAGCLLQGLAYMLYCYQARRLSTVYVPRPDNIMADIASCPSKAHALFQVEEPYLSDKDFVSSFDIAFPLPEQQTWQLAMVLIWLKSNIFETLHGKQLELRLWMAPNATTTAVRG
jgi:hypothetical protein